MLDRGTKAVHFHKDLVSMFVLTRKAQGINATQASNPSCSAWNDTLEPQQTFSIHTSGIAGHWGGKLERSTIKVTGYSCARRAKCIEQLQVDSTGGGALSQGAGHDGSFY